MLEHLDEAEKLHLSKCIYEEPSLEQAASRVLMENPNLRDAGNSIKVAILKVYIRSSEHWANVKTIRDDMGEHIEHHPYVPQLDRMKALVHQLDDGQARLEKVPKKDALNWTRLSAECRQILQCLREEARILGQVVSGDEDAESSPIVRELRKLRKEQGSTLEEQLQELGVLPTN